MMGKWMSRDDQNHVSGDGRYVQQDAKEELKWIRFGKYGMCPKVGRAFGWRDYA